MSFKFFLIFCIIRYHAKMII